MIEGTRDHLLTNTLGNQGVPPPRRMLDAVAWRRDDTDVAVELSLASGRPLGQIELCDVHAALVVNASCTDKQQTAPLIS